ncbi:MAG: hypothetical protein QNK05_24910 [Myxococcota bacterium]|nr:hypothetical protein [Myxococcota bacterium]
MKRLAFGLLALALLPVAVAAGLFVHGWQRDVPDPRFHEFDDRPLPFVVGEATPLVPGPGLPADLPLGAANNNLDVAFHAGRFFLGFRTAPHHWATDAAKLHVLSSVDRERWEHEASFDLAERDLREPRFLVLDGRLFFYFFEAADRATGFAPIGMRASERRADGSWSPDEPFHEPEHVVWRAKVHGGSAWMSVYRGSGLYEEPGRARRTRLLRSDDGRHWESVSGAESPIAQGGTSECAFEFDAEGNLVALVRVEARGALVCTAPADRLERWDCDETPYRHDSPLLFQDEGRFFALARRNLGGPIESGPGFWPDQLRFLYAQLRYWFARKRTTLYELLPEERRMVPLVDLPSAGDTAFAGIVPLGEGRFWVANYTSPIEELDPPWVVGQSRPTRIVGFELRRAPEGALAGP